MVKFKMLNYFDVFNIFLHNCNYNFCTKPTAKPITIHQWKTYLIACTLDWMRVLSVVWQMFCECWSVRGWIELWGRWQQFWFQQRRHESFKRQRGTTTLHRHTEPHHSNMVGHFGMPLKECSRFRTSYAPVTTSMIVSSVTTGNNFNSSLS